MCPCWGVGETINVSMAVFSKQHNAYLEHIHKEAKTGIVALENLFVTIQNDTSLDSDEMYDLFYYLSAYYAHLGYLAKSRHLADSYVMNLIKQEENNRKERTLFLFRKVDKHIINDLKNEKLTAGCHKGFNDPFDPLVKKIFELKSQNEIGCSHLIPSLDNVHITCFAEKGNSKKEPYQNTLMWAHYAAKHQGICIQIKVPSSFPAIDKDHEYLQYGRLDNVVYTNKKISLAKKKATYQECFLQKQTEWKYEHEVRFVYFDRTQTKDYLQIDLGDCEVEAIYFGTSCTSRIQKRVMKAMQGKTVDFYQMVPNPRDLYTLQAKTLER